jgi:hypothetical protein
VAASSEVKFPNGDGEKAAFEKDGRSRGRPTPISPFVVSAFSL